MSEHVPNIGTRGARRRRRGGYLWLLLGAALAVTGVARQEAPLLLALLLVPFTMGALGLFQAREKT